MYKKINIGAALLVLALAIVPAAVFLCHISPVTLLLAGAGAAATVTVTYQTFQVAPGGGPAPGNGYIGGTIPPTTIQSIGVTTVRALINWADTDTLITITHNMQVTALGLSALQPFVDYYFQALAAAANTYPVFTIALTNSNVVTINKVSNTGTAGTAVVRILKAG